MALKDWKKADKNWFIEKDYLHPKSHSWKRVNSNTYLYITKYTDGSYNLSKSTAMGNIVGFVGKYGRKNKTESQALRLAISYMRTH